MLTADPSSIVKKPITEKAKPLFQQLFSDTDNEDAVGRRKPQDNFHYRTDLVLVHEVDYEEKTTTSLRNIPCTSEKCNDSEDERLQLKTIHQTNPSVMEQSVNNSTYDPSFFKHISQINYFVFLLLLHWMKTQY